MIISIVTISPYVFLVASLILLYRVRTPEMGFMALGFLLTVAVHLYTSYGPNYALIEQSDGTYAPNPEGVETSQYLVILSSTGAMLSSLGFLGFALRYKRHAESDT